MFFFNLNKSRLEDENEMQSKDISKNGSRSSSPGNTSTHKFSGSPVTHGKL